MRRSHSAGGPCKLLGDHPLLSIFHLASGETRRTRTVLVAIMILISMKNKKIRRANKRLRHASLPQVVGAQDPGVFLIYSASDGAYKASRHNIY